MTAVPFVRVRPKSYRLPAAAHLLRLETSPLYLRREREASATAQQARLAALWYLDEQRTPRYGGDR